MHVYQNTDLRVALTGPPSAALEASREALAYKGFDPAEGPADLTLDLSLQDPPVVVEGLTPPESAIQVGRCAAGFVVERGGAGFVLDTALRSATAHRLPQEKDWDRQAAQDVFLAVTTSLGLLLHSLGYYALHAVGLCRGGRGYLLVGGSDSGKSTTALALVRQGWQPLSDDSLLLHEAGGTVRATGFRRDFCVDPDAADLFPELAGRSWPRQQSDPDKWRVDVAELYGVGNAGACEPRVLLFPEIGRCAESRLLPLPLPDALPLLLRHSAFPLHHDGPAAHAHVAAMGRLVKQCTVRRLVLGRDAIEATERVAELLLSIPDRR